jgi:hypothetical protein
LLPWIMVESKPGNVAVLLLLLPLPTGPDTASIIVLFLYRRVEDRWKVLQGRVQALP